MKTLIKADITPSLIEWHLAHDDQRQLAAFCDKWQINREVSPYYEVDGQNCFTMKTYFSNGGYIEAEMIQGVSLTEHYQVVDYSFGL